MTGQLLDDVAADGGIETVRWFLAHAASLPRDLLAYLPRRAPLVLDDPCTVGDWRELDHDEDVPARAIALCLDLPLSARTVASVLRNLHLQVSAPTEAQALAALNYFIENDAYAAIHATGGD